MPLEKMLDQQIARNQSQVAVADAQLALAAAQTPAARQALLTLSVLCGCATGLLAYVVTFLFG